LDELHRKVDQLIQNKKLKRWHYLVLCIVMLSLGSVLAISFFQRKEGSFDAQEHLVDELDKNKQDVGSHPAYDYWYPPPNSFGSGAYPIWNLSWVKNKVKNNVDWMLETNTGSGWFDNSEKLNVGLRWNNSGFFKVWFNVTDLEYGNHRVTFYSNIENLSSMINKTDDEIWIYYPLGNETLILAFNYSDLKNLGLTFRSGKYNGYWYFRFRKDGFSGSYSFDPWFGTQGTTGDDSEIQNTIRGYCSNNQLSPLAYATADNITFRIRNTNAGTEVARYALYYASNKTFIAETNEITLAANMGSFDWYTGNLPANTYIYSDRTYLMVANGNNNVFVKYVNPMAGFNAWRDDYNYGSWPNPTIATANNSDRGIRAFISYTNISEEPSESWTQNYTGWFTGGNISTWTQNYTGYFTGGNATVSWQQNFTGWFTGGNNSLWTQNYTGWFTGGNISTWTQNYTGYFTGGNATVSWQQNFTGYFTGGNATVTWTQNYTGWFTGGNVSTWQQNYTGYFTGGNISGKSWQQNYTGWFTGGNTSRIWTQNYTGYFTGGNVSNYQQNFSGYFTGGNVSRTWQQNYTGYFTGGNVSVVFDITNEYPLNLSNIYDDQPTIYFTLTHPTGGKLMNYSVLVGNSSVNCTTYLFNGTNVTSGVQIDPDHLYYTCTEYYTDYYFSIHANDNTSWVNETYNFQAILQGGGKGGINPLSVGLSIGILGGMTGGVLIIFVLMGKKKKEKRDREEIYYYEEY